MGAEEATFGGGRRPNDYVGASHECPCLVPLGEQLF
jgi:hypothetical protein